jgi:PST family polysaccharide transporter
MILRVVAWPLGFIIVAKGAQALFFWTEVIATAVHVGLAWLLVSRFGVTGAGAAFFGLYVWHGLLIYTIVRHTSGFRWAASSLRIGAIFLPLTGAVFASFYVLPSVVAAIAGLTIAAASGVYSVRTLLHLVPVESIPRMVWNCARLLRLTNSLSTE